MTWLLVSPQLANDIGNRILLEQADASDPCGPGFQACLGIIEGHASKSQDWNIVPASPVELINPWSAGTWQADFLEHRSKDDKVCVLASD